VPEVVEAIPGMNNITVVLRNPHTLALDAIERLQRWWEESEALEPESRRLRSRSFMAVRVGRIWRGGSTAD
jgi:allophanate hydrolase subunit 1